MERSERCAVETLVPNCSLQQEAEQRSFALGGMVAVLRCAYAGSRWPMMELGMVRSEMEVFGGSVAVPMEADRLGMPRTRDRGGQHWGQLIENPEKENSVRSIGPAARSGRTESVA